MALPQSAGCGYRSFAGLAAIQRWQLAFLFSLDGRPIRVPVFSIDFGHHRVDAAHVGHFGEGLSVEKECPISFVSFG